jgi:hypothetical protein
MDEFIDGVNVLLLAGMAVTKESPVMHMRKRVGGRGAIPSRELRNWVALSSLIAEC